MIEDWNVKMAENVVGILIGTVGSPGETGPEASGGIEIVMAEETLAAVQTEARGEKTVLGKVGTRAAAGSETRAAAIVTEEISRRVVEMEEEQVLMRGTGTTVAATTAIGASAEVATETAAAEIETTTEIVVTGRELAAIEIEKRIAVAEMDPMTPAGTSDVMINQSGAHDGVHRRMLSHPSPWMFRSPIQSLDLLRMPASCLVLPR